MSNRPIKKTDSKTPWARRKSATSRLQRKTRKIQCSFRIYCEGENTEPEYFKSFPINPQLSQVFAEGYGRQKKALVEHVLKLLRSDGYLKGQANYDSRRQLWVVFDYDYKGQTHEKHDFQEAIALAERNNLKVAYSNDSFELWLVLHFNRLFGRTHRKDLCKFLDTHLGFSYIKIGKTQKSAQGLYAKILDKQNIAIQNAIALHEEQSKLDIHEQNPITTIHHLVIELNKYLRQ